MAAILRITVLCLLLHDCLCSVDQTNRGCKKWTLDESTTDVCCQECHEGNRLVNKCGPRVSSLCTPCEPGTYTVNLKSSRCLRCTQCVGALTQVKACTPMTDTVCGCKEGLVCGDASCSFCTKKCNIGEEPTDKRLCRPCPEGTFNDQIHQKCKQRISKCPDEHVMVKGDAITDNKCINIPVGPLHKPTLPDATEQDWPLVLSVVTSMALMGFSTIIIITVVVKILKKRKKSKKMHTEVTKKPIIRVPTDDPRTLIAIECSFHEAQQEQGSSTESLDSKDSSDHLIA